MASGSNVDVSTSNTALPSTAFSAAMVPFWDDIDSDTGNVYWEQRQVGGINTLIVQWDNRPRYPNTGSATFQVQLFESGPVIARYAYRDVDFGNAQYNLGPAPQIGFQVDSTTGFEFSRDQAVLDNNDVVDVMNLPPTTDEDLYTVDLADSVGSRLDVVLGSVPGQPLSQFNMQLLDSIEQRGSHGHVKLRRINDYKLQSGNSRFPGHGPRRAHDPHVGRRVIDLFPGGDRSAGVRHGA